MLFDSHDPSEEGRQVPRRLPEEKAASRIRRWLPRLALLAAVLPHALPLHRDRLREASWLRRTPMEQRKAALFGPWYSEAVVLSRAVGTDRTIDLVMVAPAARDIAVLGGAVLQPRDVRFFDGWACWRARRRAIFLHDDRAANAAPGPPPPPGHVVIAVDPTAAPHFRVMANPR